MAGVIHVPEGFGDGGDALVLNPSGSLVAVWVAEQGSNRGTITVYRVADGERVAGPEKVGDSRGAVFIDDKTLLVASGNKCLRWEIPGKPKTLATFRGLFLTALGARPKLPVFAVATDANNVIVCDLATGKERWWAAAPGELDPNMLTFSRKGKLLACRLTGYSDSDTQLMVCDVKTGRRLQLHLPETEVTALTYAPDDTTLLALMSGDRGKDVIRMYRTGAIDPHGTIRLPKLPLFPYRMRLTADGVGLHLIDPSGDWCRVDAATGALQRTVESPVLLEPNFAAAVVSADGKVMAGVAEDWTVAAWPLDDGKQKPARKAKS